MTEFFNRSSERAVRRKLRAGMPAPELVLWSRLKGKQLLGLRFRRQYSVGPFILDFYCPQVRIGIELDGDSHYSEEAPARDARRDQYIAQFGIRILRFTNKDVMDNLGGVLTSIAEVAQRAPANPP